MTTARQEEAQAMRRARSGLGFLLGSTGIQITGQGMVIAAAPLLAASITRDPLAVSAVTAASYAAWIFVGLIAGALVDHWPRRTVMIVTDLCRAAVVGLLALLIATGLASIGVLVAIVFLIGVGSCFFDPAAQAAIPLVVGREKDALARANGKLWALDTFGRSLIGPPVGAAAFAIAAALPFGIDAAAFVASALLLIGLPRIDTNGAPTTRSKVLRSVSEGIRFLFTHGHLRALAFGMAAYNFSYNVAFATLVLFAQDRLHLTDAGFGFLLAAGAVGGVAGGWLAPHVSNRLTALQVYAVTLAVQGLAWLLVMSTGSGWAAGAGLVIVGLASTVVSAVGGSARQILTPDSMLGRMTSVTRLLGIGAAAVGAVLGGGVATVGGLMAPFIVAAALLLTFAVAFVLLARRFPPSA